MESPFKRCILLYIFAILIQGGGADAVQLTASQRGLEHIARIHRAFGLARTHHGMQFIYKQDDLPLLLGQITQQRLQPLFKLAAEFGPGNQRSQIQREQPLVLDPLRHLAVYDTLGQTLHDGGLAHPWLTDQYRIVLGAALQHLDGAADLIIPSDHRVQPALLGPLGQIDGVFLQGLSLLFRIWVVDRLAIAHLVHGLFQRLFVGPGLAQQFSQWPLIFYRCQHEQFAGDIAVLALLRQLIGLIEQSPQIIGYV